MCRNHCLTLRVLSPVARVAEPEEARRSVQEAAGRSRSSVTRMMYSDQQGTCVPEVSFHNRIERVQVMVGRSVLVGYWW